MEEVKDVMKNLKTNVSRDPLGYANELFHPAVAGEDLIKAMTILVNRIKKKQVIPKILQLCNILSIWKQKSPRNSFDSCRGVFRVCFRNILDRLIYKHEYHKVDSKLTDCNVGSRKQRNIRDHIFVMNAVMNSVKKTGLKKHLTVKFMMWTSVTILCGYMRWPMTFSVLE